MDYIRVAKKTEVPTNTMITVVAGGKDILLANVDESYYAIANKCTHLSGSLAKGDLEAGVVTCPRHGARFDVKTGEAVGPAKLGPMKMKVANEASYPVKIEGEDIFIGIA